MLLSVGQRILSTLADRSQTSVAEVGIHREFLVALGGKLGIDVPSFLRADGGFAVEDSEQMRTWMEQVLSTVVSKTEKSRGGRRGGGGRGGGASGATGH